MSGDAKKLSDLTWKLIADRAGLALPKSAAGRHRMALKAIDIHSAIYREGVQKDDRKVQVVALANSRFVARVLMDEILGWSLDAPYLPSAHDNEAWGHPRTLLLSLIELAEGFSPIEHQATLSVPLMLPVPLMNTLRDSLEALDQGEVHQLVMPKSDGRHDAWTWDRMRLRAVQHVEFLHGQGIGIGKAREKVQKETGIAIGTLVKLSQEFNKDETKRHLVRLAFLLGQKKTTITINSPMML
ncbi:hypothetical protein [Mesorhizobium huakuii]|uniref:Uncharacterized protein n=1 Tax=Mesorhizobium huakuii TaxID=28104 RepID=A0A7G6SUP6_9HYPH|nr:hypothetical protein [Mesorhizobium huakuii]QND58228.1 hypothetical protein HB778_17745 [Mesorhizobium huakuii]